MAIKTTRLEDVPEGEEIVWTCYRVSDGNGTPAIPWSKKDKCSDCGEDIWYDPLLLKSHPQLKLAKKICLFCATTRAINVKADGKEVKLQYPHREN